MKMECKIGQKVVVLHGAEFNPIQIPIIGVIIDTEMSDDLSYHGSPWYETIYTVKTPDGEIYRGTYGSDYIYGGNGYYFVTIDGEIYRAERNIENNLKEIDYIEETNIYISEYITKLKLDCAT
jgi:hypothetical protein